MRTCFSNIAAAIGLVALACAAPNLYAQGPQPWDVATGDWNDDVNWLNVVVPDAGFGDTALINNGGTATLNTAADFPVGGVAVGPGTLEMTATGSLTVIDASGSDASATGFFSTSGAGLLSMTDNASISVAGPVNLSGTTSITGPSAAFTAAGNFNFGLSSVYRPTITNSTTHSVIGVDGTAMLRGAVRADFDGVTPSAGDAWTLVDATTVEGSFGTVSATGLPQGTGLAGAVEVTPGGRGSLVQLTIQQRLVLQVDRQSGATSIKNFAASGISIEGYSVASQLGLLDASDAAWNSLQDQGVPNWVETPGSETGLAELDSSAGGSLAIAGSADRSIGNVFDPLLPFGSGLPQDLVFKYRDATLGVVSGVVEYSGDLRANNLVLTVDPATGNAQVRNASPDISVDLEGYTVTSAAGALLTGFDSSLPDSEWAETGGSATGIGELNFTTGATTLAPGATFDLTGLYSAANGAEDLVFQFRRRLSGEGDFNQDGVVDGDDLSGSPESWESRFGDDLDGGDFLGWQRGFGEGAAGGGEIVTGIVQYTGTFPAVAGAAQIPEPTGVLLLIGAAAMAGCGRGGSRVA